MATIKQRIASLEAKSKSRPLLDTPEFWEDYRIADEYFEANGKRPDTLPREDFTEMQSMILSIIIESHVEYCSG
jgi:hypothetical protein